MSRYRGPRLRISRRLGDLPGLTRKTSKKLTPAGEHGQQLRKPSEYSLRLEEKQKLRFNYGLTEKQLSKYIKIAKKVTGSTGLILLQILEMRLDNIIFRLGLSPTIPAARQLINHGHILINNKKVSICSYQCKPGDVIQVQAKNSSQTLVKNNLNFPTLASVPNHLELNTKSLNAKVNAIIEREWVALQMNELLVVEYYSRK
uniref:Small ribosomal subunit protein uS4c n=1 Tax=Gracilaria vermiculophylla TaxID=2608709 RepID=A0A345U8V9_9FLOR|nr:ribosomal protein S4 [Gracilaria vermiculophylla]AXI96895.1 ribosomal protein S4 [Gracilaria vermiculophylla]QXU75106.1 ribosomal protein S4 [Gracilaria vermiculophylla]WDZ67956.1 ribosomal protein S4 [Gracilaria vermiculophylla]